MGVVNVTPDSFSDSGRFGSAREAADVARAMLADGAALVDVGGESTRPGSDPVTPEEELRRVRPVLELLAGERVSVDTSRAVVDGGTCGEWRGCCLDPSPTFVCKVVTVHCRCQNDNRCAACSGFLYERKLNANYFKPSDGHIWHVPGFCSFSHRCPTPIGDRDDARPRGTR